MVIFVRVLSFISLRSGDRRVLRVSCLEKEEVSLIKAKVWPNSGLKAVSAGLLRGRCINSARIIQHSFQHFPQPPENVRQSHQNPSLFRVRVFGKFIFGNQNNFTSRRRKLSHQRQKMTAMKIITSENDKRLYRVITLENGLRAMLVSTAEVPDDDDDGTDDDDDEDGDESMDDDATSDSG